MFKNSLELETINNLGFNKVKLGNKELTLNLKKTYNKYFSSKKNQDELNVSHNNPKFKKSLQVHDEIVEIVKPFFDEVFEDYQFLASHFVVKRSKNSESMQLHQDWNVVDEQKYLNYQVWIPLDLSYPENGGMCFIPKSHQFYNNIRSGSFGMPIVEIEQKIHENLAYLRLFPGEACVFFSKTFHGSFVNSTPKDRLAVLINIIPKKAKPLYFHKSKNYIDTYKFSTSFIFENLHLLEKGLMPPSAVKIGSRRIEKPQINNTKISLSHLLTKVKEVNLSNNLPQNYEFKTLSIIKNPGLELEVNSNGYAVIDFLDTKALQSLRNEFAKYFPNREKYSGAFSGMNELNLKDRKEMYYAIKQIIEPALASVFKNYRLPICSFYSRKPDGNYLLDWHSDPSFILNEHIESIYGIWCPLLDVDENTGTLKIVPNSHRLVNKLHFAYKTSSWALSNKRRLLDNYSKSFKLKAGQAILFDGRIIHGSDPNISNVNRDNIVMRVNHENSDYFSMRTKNSPTDEKGMVIKHNTDFFFSEEITEHNTQTKFGEEMGEMYLFNDEVEDEYIHKKLK